MLEMVMIVCHIQQEMEEILGSEPCTTGELVHADLCRVLHHDKMGGGCKPRNVKVE